MSSLLAHPAAAEHQESDRESHWFSDFYKRTFDSAYRYACLLTRDSGLAEDLVSDAYVRAWVNRCVLLENPSATGWVLSVIRNRVADEFRSRRATVDLDEIVEPEDVDSFDSLPELTEDQKDAIQRAIQRLTPEQQQVIFLRFFQHMEHERVARELGRTANAVRAIQFRALHRMRRLLEAELVR